MTGAIQGTLARYGTELKNGATYHSAERSRTEGSRIEEVDAY